MKSGLLSWTQRKELRTISQKFQKLSEKNGTPSLLKKRQNMRKELNSIRRNMEINLQSMKPNLFNLSKEWTFRILLLKLSMKILNRNLPTLLKEHKLSRNTENHWHLSNWKNWKIKLNRSMLKIKRSLKFMKFLSMSIKLSHLFTDHCKRKRIWVLCLNKMRKLWKNTENNSKNIKPNTKLDW